MDSDKRYQVFVSSTYTDLFDARAEVMQALLELDCMPAGMELFPAANEPLWVHITGNWSELHGDGVSVRLRDGKTSYWFFT